jgi:predicted nuclease of restriction endonuclease-like (RecB) superfamily
MKYAHDRFGSVEPTSSIPGWYADLLGSVSRHVPAGRRRAVATATRPVVLTYWQVEREILDRQTYEGYGSRVIDRLSTDLERALPDATGFSPRNLRYMRAFAAAWPDLEMVQRSAGHSPWRHHQYLLDKLESQNGRLWYAAQPTEQGWSRDVLASQIETRLRERSGKAITNFDHALPPEQSDLAQRATKDAYLFDFLGTTEPMLERDLERKLLEHVSDFLLELVEGFALVGKQARLTLRGDEFWCDLLFYPVRLRRYVVVELKAVAFKAEFGGKLGMCLDAVDDRLVRDDEKPTDGLLLCKSQNSVVAEYALRSNTAPIGVAEWATSITDSLPDDLVADLPSIETLEAELARTHQEDTE